MRYRLILLAMIPSVVIACSGSCSPGTIAVRDTVITKAEQCILPTLVSVGQCIHAQDKQACLVSATLQLLACITVAPPTPSPNKTETPVPVPMSGQSNPDAIPPTARAYVSKVGYSRL